MGVTTTGIFCRLTCPARKPRPENCQWFDSPAAALGAGFRPCLRCRPVAPEAEGDPVVRRMLDALASDPARRWTEAGVAALVGFKLLADAGGDVEAFGLRGRSAEQRIAIDCLLDESIGIVSLGARWQIIKQLALSATATQVIYVPVDTNGQSLLNEWQSPTRQPSGDGVYRQFISLVTFYVDVALF